MSTAVQGLSNLLERIDALVPPEPGDLVEELFRFVSRRTPLVNVDLLIQRRGLDGAKETLLTWRHDEFYSGWHVPGGVVRFKESLLDRVAAVARTELGATVTCEPEPTAVFNKINSERTTRGHFVALLFPCSILHGPSTELRCLDVERPVPGHWAWHKGCPGDFLPQQEVYRRFLDGS